jgi:hypothetical protein
MPGRSPVSMYCTLPKHADIDRGDAGETVPAGQIDLGSAFPLETQMHIIIPSFHWLLGRLGACGGRSAAGAAWFWGRTTCCGDVSVNSLEGSHEGGLAQPS